MFVFFLKEAMDEHYDFQAAGKSAAIADMRAPTNDTITSGAGLESITQDRVKRKAESQLSAMTEARNCLCHQTMSED
jgi:hypothetical protein